MRVGLTGLHVRSASREELWPWPQTVICQRVVIFQNTNDVGERHSRAISPQQETVARQARSRAIRRGLRSGTITFVERSVSRDTTGVRWFVSVAGIVLVAMAISMVGRGMRRWWPPASGLDLAIVLAGVLLVGTLGSFVGATLWMTWSCKRANTRKIQWDRRSVSWEAATGIVRSVPVSDILTHRIAGLNSVSELHVRGGEAIVFDGSRSDREMVLQALRPDLTTPRASRHSEFGSLRPLVRLYLIASVIVAAAVLGIAYIGGVLTLRFALSVAATLAMLPVTVLLGYAQYRIEHWRTKAAKRRRA